MPLILLIVFLLSPRLGAALLALFTTWFQMAGLGLIAVVLGIIFAPVTLLWYAAVINWFGGQWGILQILVLLLALAIDFGSSGYGYTNRHYYIVERVDE